MHNSSSVGLEHKGTIITS